MAFTIDAGRNRKCKNTIGGIRNAYLAPYRKVLRSEIIYDGVTLFQFPTTTIYKFELVANDFPSQTPSENEGGKFMSQSAEFTFIKLSAYDNQEFTRLMRKDYWLIIEDRNGNFFLYGFRNGMTCERVTSDTSQIYKISFSGEEENFAPFVTDLIGVDFIIGEGNEFKLFQDGIEFLFQDGQQYTFN